jgi:hypothetical protein
MKNKLFLNYNLKKWIRSKPRLNPYTYIRIGVWRFLTNRFRLLPDFIIIGVEKGGTTSLYDYIITHPCVVPSKTKEVHYFDTNYLGLWWYRSHFHSIFKKLWFKILKKKLITGEASPYYLFHPLSAKRIFKDLPKVKLIVILRNPIDRAFSHYQDNLKKNQEDYSFEDAIKNEKSRLKGEKEKMIENPRYNSRNYWLFSYLSKGIYYEQLEQWFKIFPKKQFLILETNQLKSNYQEVLNEVFNFLDIPTIEMGILDKKNVGKYEKMNQKTRKSLEDYFSLPNSRLEEILDRNFAWR